jgi:CubicO group peptidase (beta-lactamase class C family)
MTRALTISLAGLAAGAAWPVFAAGSCPAPGYVQKAQALVQPYVEDNAFTGSVLVAVDGKPVFRQGFGLADRELSVANTPDTEFRLGSITKQFTATAILQLAEQGKLKIDDPVSKYYTDAPPAWAKVTIKHLLTHTSGIPTYTALPDFFAREARLPHTPEELIKLTRDRPLDFDPGTKYAYDNSGYILLGWIVEKVSGQSYADYLQQHIFGPLGMSHSGYDSSEKIIPHRASGYRFDDKGWSNAPFLDMSGPYAAGSLYSDVDDMLVWDQALNAAKPLAAASLQQMFTDYGHQYGFGFVVDKSFAHDRIWHNGGINGFSTSFQRYPKDRLTVVVLSNIEGAPSDKIATDLAGLCLGATTPLRAIALAPALLGRYAGFYELTPALVWKIEVQGDHLLVHPGGQRPVPVYASAPGEFFARIQDVKLSFKPDAAGQVTGVVVRGAADSTYRRISAEEAQKLADAQAARAKSGVASPGAEAALRRMIGELQAGQPRYDLMSDGFAQITRQQLPQLQGMLNSLGPLESLTFKEVGPAGGDVFLAKFAKGALLFSIIVGPDGKIVGAGIRPPG